ncbi:MAG: hypothetical protein DLM64_05150 [Solirubrobacterales bacterium]|nr:MAG: hypothetical protein DLM64_05150 [Solirubrobacterales bacterium]
MEASLTRGRGGRLTHSQRTSHTRLAALGVWPVVRYPCNWRTLPDAAGRWSALSRR